MSASVVGEGRRHSRPSVVIPAFNEAATIRDVVERALAHTSAVIVVDDGSTDGTAERVRDMRVLIVVNDANAGKAASIWRAAEIAMSDGASGIVTIDGDGQHDPDDLPKIFRAAARRPKAIVVGARLHARDTIPRVRYLANRFANFWVAWAAGRPIADSQSGFRYYPAAVFNSLDLRHDRWASFVFESEVLIAAARTGLEIVFVPISVRYADPARASHLHPLYDIGKIAAMIFKRLLRIRFDPRDLAHGLGANQSRRPPADPIARHSRKP
jgi:glycosyltransferase involved in cell wall biosynthesis